MSFKTKFEWLRSRGAIDQGDLDILEDVRVLRNSLAHIRPTESRRRISYQGHPLLTKHCLRKLLRDVELTLRNIRNRSGGSARLMTVPPGYADELNWPTEYVEAFKKKTT